MDYDTVINTLGAIADVKKGIENIEFTAKQKDWICYQIGEWYLGVKNDIADYDQKTHRLGSAKEMLKVMICGATAEDDEDDGGE